MLEIDHHLMSSELNRRRAASLMENVVMIRSDSGCEPFFDEYLSTLANESGMRAGPLATGHELRL
jgi:hypothetical protein